ncbi:MAG: hypothetical protein ACKVE4_01885 [Dissulfuribacterales bacterium]
METDCNGHTNFRRFIVLSRSRTGSNLLISFLNSHPKYYEDLVAHLEDTFGNVTDFLDLEYEGPKTTLKKQNPERLSDLVTNYSELKEAFSGTEWQAFFEDELFDL